MCMFLPTNAQINTTQMNVSIQSKLMDFCTKFYRFIRSAPINCWSRQASELTQIPALNIFPRAAFIIAQFTLC